MRREPVVVGSTHRRHFFALSYRHRAVLPISCPCAGPLGNTLRFDDEVGKTPASLQARDAMDQPAVLLLMETEFESMITSFLDQSVTAIDFEHG